MAVEERLQRPAVMGIVNVTPDSFSDGGAHLDADACAVAAARRAWSRAPRSWTSAESRPGPAPGVSVERSCNVLPVLERLEGLPLSIDTAKSGSPVARSGPARSS